MKKFMLPQVVLDVIKFTVAPSGNRVVTLDGFTAPCGAVVDWGDGAFSPLTSTAALSHTYANTTARQIVIRGILGGFWNTGGSAGKTLVTSLDEISSRSLVTLQNAFRGCTGLRAIPAALTIPNVGNFNYAFYQIRSITSNLTPLWQTHASKPHTGCFTDCCKSLYGQYGTGCPHRQYVAAVPQQTYYQKYGQSGCPAVQYVPGSPGYTYYDWYGTSSCPRLVVYTHAMGVDNYLCPKCSTWIYFRVPYNISHCCDFAGAEYSQVISAEKRAHNSYCIYYDPTAHENRILRMCRCDASCTKVYSYGSPSRYNCTHFGGTCKGSGCTRTYRSGQSAYYRCTRSGGTCQSSSCPYPYANETSYNNARNNGWA